MCMVVMSPMHAVECGQHFADACIYYLSIPLYIFRLGLSIGNQKKFFARFMLPYFKKSYNFDIANNVYIAYNILNL